VFIKSHHLSLSWATLIQSTPSCPIVFNIHFNIMLPSMPWSYKCSLCFRFPYRRVWITPFSPTRATCHMPRPSPSSSFDDLNNI
jgi:hypothetical protein